MSSELFVPEDFAVPRELVADGFRLEPLGPQHNEADYAAWTASVGHIRTTPGFAGSSWPREMTLQQNLRDLERHAQDFADRRGFTYTVLDIDTGDVVGCVYIYPARGPGHGDPGLRRAAVRSWVCADCAALDPALYDAVLAWLERDWPFDAIEYAARALCAARDDRQWSRPRRVSLAVLNYVRPSSGQRSGTAVRKDAELVALWVGKYDPALVALADVGVSST